MTDVNDVMMSMLSIIIMNDDSMIHDVNDVDDRE